MMDQHRPAPVESQRVDLDQWWLTADQLAVLRAWLQEMHPQGGDARHVALYLEDALHHDARLQPVREAILHELALTIAAQAEQLFAHPQYDL